MADPPPLDQHPWTWRLWSLGLGDSGLLDFILPFELLPLLLCITNVKRNMKSGGSSRLLLLFFFFFEDSATTSSTSFIEDSTTNLSPSLPLFIH
jgi:hypothetical protein